MNLFIKNTNSCNNQCTICCAGFANGNTEAFDFMGMGLFSLLINKLSSSQYKDEITLIFGFDCEPTIDPTLSNKIKMSKDVGIKTSILTNGKIATELFDSGIEPNLWIVSILGGAVGENSYKNITGIELSDTLERIEYLLNHGQFVNINVTLDVNEISLLNILNERFKNTNSFMTLNFFNNITSTQREGISTMFKNSDDIKIYFSDCSNPDYNNISECKNINMIYIDIELFIYFCMINDDAKKRIYDLKTIEFDDAFSMLNEVRKNILEKQRITTCVGCAAEFNKTYAI